MLPATAWYLILLVLPLAFVVVFSFGTRSPIGGYGGGFTLQNYAAVLNGPGPFITSLTLAVLGTLLCLAIGLPLAYFIATRAGDRKSLFIVLLVIPFWTSFLIRTYAWLAHPRPGRDRRVHRRPRSATRAFRILGTECGVLIGLVYGYLPLMVFPLYVTLERMDRTLVEASKDLGAGRFATFRQITLPIALARPHHRQHPRVHPDDGRVRHPADPRLRPRLHDRQRRSCCASSKPATGRPARPTRPC